MTATANSIIERMSSLEGNVSAKTRDALRKAVERDYLPSTKTLMEIATNKGTTVSYLLGETDESSVK